ncbi:MAG: RsmE family RNA methyltransferase [Candidatus Marinimicrobia bacterium]|nr:RsmE family RNA methyltransferase [Candidatus Neomarinimicrobiota bacterium]MDD5582219.1 RsmE family RNA methyltransferase [Candidatus Neomarinimicrobiota bacterium]
MANEQYVYVPSWHPDQVDVEIQQDEHHHLFRVLRKIRGDHIIIVNGKGAGAVAEICDITKEKTRCQILTVLESPRTSRYQVHLAVGVIRRPRWEWLLEKTVELGVSTLIPLYSQFTLRNSSSPEREQKIMISALKQCGRFTLPLLTKPISFQEAIKKASGEKILLHYAPEVSYLSDLSLKGNEITLFIGPEGGFSKEEVAYADQENVQKAHLGNIRLRTETAAINSAAYFTYWKKEVYP